MNINKDVSFNARCVTYFYVRRVKQKNRKLTSIVGSMAQPFEPPDFLALLKIFPDTFKYEREMSELNAVTQYFQTL